MFRRLSKVANILVPALVALVTIAATVYLRSAQNEITRERLVAETTVAGSNFAARLETHIAARLNAAKLLGLYFQGQGGRITEEFRAQAEPFHVLFTDLQALNWVDAAGVVRIVTPEEGNAAALGLDVRSLPVPAAALAEAERTGALQVTPPITLAQGGGGFVAYLPVRAEGGIAGFLNIVFRTDPLMRSALGRRADSDFVVRVTDGDAVLYATAASLTPDGPSAQNRIDVGGREWVLAVAPSEAYLQSADPFVDEATLIFGGFLALFTAALCRLVMDRQAALRRNRARFQDFARASSDWFWETDADLNVIWASEGAEDFFGVPREQLFGRKRGQFWQPEGDEDIWPRHRADLEARRPFKELVYGNRIGDEVKWARSSGVPHFAPDGTFQGYRGTAADITEQVRARKRAERANELLANAVENLNESVTLWDEDDRLVLGNRKFRELTQDIPEFIQPGTTFADFIRASVDHNHMAGIEGREEEFIEQSIRQRGKPSGDPIFIKRTDGVILQLHEQKLDNGYLVTTGLDVTTLRENELALRASEQRLALAVRHLTIWDWDAATDTLYVSPGFAEKLGYTPEEFDFMRREAIGRLIHPDDIDDYQEAMERHFADPSREFTSQHRFMTKSGDYRWHLAIGQLVTDDDGAPLSFNGVLTDITERVELEAQLRQSQKMEAIGNLTGGFAHDFNNLLAVIMGNLELIEVGRDEDLKAEYLRNAIQATSRGGDLTRNLLSFARKALLNPKRLDLNLVTADMLAMLKRVLPETIRIEVQDGADLWAVHADKTSFENAVLNLAINARDAMPEGGVIAISTENVTLTEAEVDDNDEPLAPGAYVAFSLADTGEGIPADMLEEVFTPYFTTKPLGHGSGLGLSMVHGFMRQTGGAVRIASEVGKGTTVRLLFPATAQAAAEEVEDEAAEAGEAVSGRVLLVEDDEDVRLALERQLGSMGLVCVVVGCGDEAVAAAETSGPFDLLITDVVMPGALQGPDLARTLREGRPELKVIIISGYPKEAGTPGEGPSVEDARLMKPISRRDMARAIREVLG